MSDDEFVHWVKDFRAKIVEIWDDTGTPPRIGYTRSNLISQFKRLRDYPARNMLLASDGEVEPDCIMPVKTFAAATDQFFPNMFKTKINYGNGLVYSIYDFLSNDDLLPRYLRLYAFRHFKRDSYYYYSQNIPVGEKTPISDNPISDGLEYIKAYDRYSLQYHMLRQEHQFDYWLAPVKEKKIYTGFHDEFHDTEFLRVKTEDILGMALPYWRTSSVDQKAPYHEIRQYNRSTKIFPAGYRTFQTSFAHRPSGFNPSVAKLIYELYTEEFKHEPEIYVYDPSAGWGGRIAGAMTVADDRHLVYLGTDPNRDMILENDENRYACLANFINCNTRGGLDDHPYPHETRIWMLGSEVIGHDPKFKEYRGKVSLVFSSPPYFTKEVYSADPEQSCHKFPGYDDWIRGFLQPTLQTAMDWLRPGGYLAWNIADIPMAGGPVALEKPSADILTALGMRYLRTYKMILSRMPGQHRSYTDGSCGYKNAVKLKGKWTRFEPITIWQKPL